MPARPAVLPLLRPIGGCRRALAGRSRGRRIGGGRLRAGSVKVFGPRMEFLQVQQIIDRLSPNTLYAESALALLHPATRALGPILISQLQGALLGAPLPASQSFILIWPQLTGLIAATIVIFVIAYIAFQRQEIRA